MNYETLGLLAALLFGVAFNWHIDNFNRKNGDLGMAGIFVVAGVSITLLIAALVPDNPAPLIMAWNGTPFVLGHNVAAVLYVLPFFAASGLPMVAGSLWRYLRTLK